ncbi:hypothetical protein D8Y22_06590 [Salinadaptatus halalkaliphilus]|uniref:Terminase large subunit gp17-like C-terminal domain-containing protein n=1 Tax=Salinadaptatus halalkaliphilus TaxID=2419781 RepID=A0A4V3VLG8_9EURY|nr:terminase family protein [Salinadaptatus halalkaliphilus]THE65597.1 hypothetical protein D8Y22_06590 [Salinadaptatus halalkaliphilus]
MSRIPTEGEITSRLENIPDELESTTGDEITVLWGTADPERRPHGVTWVPETGALTYDLWSAQRNALETVDSGENDITAFLAGYGSGKTIFGARWLIKQALEHDGSRFLAMGIDFQKARDATFRVLFEQLPGERTGIVTSSYNGPEQSPIVTDYNRQNHRLTLVNDSVIKLGSADRWNRYAGDSYGGVWLDEPSHYGEDLHDLLEMIGSRLRGVDGPKTQLWTLTGNGYNAAFDILERGIDSDGNELGLKIETVRASTLENPYLDSGEKERFERQFGNTGRESQALFGGFADGGGKILRRDQLKFVDEDDVAVDWGACRYHVGVDLAYVADKRKAEATDSDYTAFVVVAEHTSKARAYVFDLARERGLSLQEQIEMLARIADQLPNPHVKIEDVGAQSYFVQEARRKVPGQIQAVNPTQSKTERIQDMSVVFERGDAVLLNEERDENLGYDARFRPFVREWLEFGNDQSPDLLDAAYYALHGIHLGGGGSRQGMYSFDPYGGEKGEG